MGTTTAGGVRLERRLESSDIETRCARRVTKTLKIETLVREKLQRQKLADGTIQNTKWSFHTRSIISGKVLDVALASINVWPTGMELLVDLPDVVIKLGYPLVVETIRDVLETVFSVTFQVRARNELVPDQPVEIIRGLAIGLVRLEDPRVRVPARHDVPTSTENTILFWYEGVLNRGEVGTSKTRSHKSVANEIHYDDGEKSHQKNTKKDMLSFFDIPLSVLLLFVYGSLISTKFFSISSTT